MRFRRTVDPAVRAVRSRSNTELRLLVLAVLVVLCAYALVGLSQEGMLPADLSVYAGTLAAMAVGAHLCSRRLARGADPLLLPLAFLLNGLGLAMVRRIDFAYSADDPGTPALAPAQTVWTVVGLAAFCLTLAVVRDTRVLDSYRYLIGACALGLLVLPLVPGLGYSVRGAQLWVRLAGFTVQPAEFAKIGLTVFYASYLAEKRALLSEATSRLGPLLVPPARAFGPVLVAWLASLAVLVFQNDLGLSLLFFGAFVLLLYIATGRLAYPTLGALLFAAGGLFAWSTLDVVRLRIAIWLDVWSLPDEGYQLAQSLFALGTGGMLGVGWGQGRPDFIPDVHTDFIFAAFGEEAGLVGTTALLLCYFLIVGRGFATTLRCRDDFEALLGAGLTVLFGLQVFVILGGVTRLIPLTGLTLPFVSYGGSSLVANYVLVALLLRLSANQPRPARRRAAAHAAGTA
ncbi:cell shape-determining peptidoglycan glycosyltransferase RodA [soil metagenome]